MEMATARGVYGVRHPAFQHNIRLFDARVRYRDRCQKSLGVRMTRRRVENRCRCFFDNPPEIHYGDAVTHVLDHTKVMRNEQI